MAKVYWITGLAGSGKTSIGKPFFEELKNTEPSAVFLDGDELREVFGGVFGYSEEERRKCAMCYSRLCKMLSDQGITVVICTVSMFHSVRKWNRDNIEGYVEIYIKVPFEELARRDKKGLYSRTTSESEKTVAGVDFEFEEPEKPDVVIVNDGNKSIEELKEHLKINFLLLS